MKRLESFTLVELMIAVSILSIGMVFVLRSFLVNASALSTSQNRISALQFLETKLDEYEEKVKQEKGVKPGSSSEEVRFNNIAAVYDSTITPIDAEELKESLNEVRLLLSWQEENKNKDEILATYLENYKKE